VPKSYNTLSELAHFKGGRMQLTIVIKFKKSTFLQYPKDWLDKFLRKLKTKQADNKIAADILFDITDRRTAKQCDIELFVYPTEDVRSDYSISAFQEVCEKILYYVKDCLPVTQNPQTISLRKCLFSSNIEIHT